MNFIKITLLLLCFYTALPIYAQSESKDVTITTSGSGKTIEEAKQSALRSAIEQSFGAFISSKTEIFNDQIVADQMASVTSGNIKSFELLNQDQLPDGRWGVTLKAIVSVDKLTSFVQAKGIAIEVKGGMFALNIKQQLLNEQGEIKAVAEMIGLLHEPMQISFDYVIKSSDPKSLDAESKNWEIPLVVTATCNKNIDFCANYFKKTLAALSLSPSEVETYKSLNKQVFPVSVTYQNQTSTYNLRKQSSISAIQSLKSNWEFYTRLFTVQSGMDELYGIGKENQFEFAIDNREQTDENNADENFELNFDESIERTDNFSASISFPTSGIVARTFRRKDKRTLSQIEQMTGYKVIPRGVVSYFKYGGYLAYEKDGHGLIAAIIDLEKMDWNSAKAACDELTLNGYSDWHLPTKLELDTLYYNMKSIDVGGFEKNFYWSSDEKKSNEAWPKCFDTYCPYYYFNHYYDFDKTNKFSVRAVRVF